MDIKLLTVGSVKSSAAVSAIVHASLCAYIRMSAGWKARRGIAMTKRSQAIIFTLLIVLPKSHTNSPFQQQPKAISLPILNTTFYQSFSFLPTWWPNNAISLLFWLAFSCLLMRDLFSDDYAPFVFFYPSELLISPAHSPPPPVDYLPFSSWL